MKNFKINADILKILALVCMTVDHVGLMLLNDYLPFRLIGRLAFPIFAYFIAEGCKYTRNKPKHFALIFGLGLICQLVYYFAMGSLYMSILIVFSLSVIIIYAIAWAEKQKSKWAYAVPALITAALYAVYYLLKIYLKNTDFDLDYGFMGVLAPVAIYIAPKKWLKLLLLGICLIGTSTIMTTPHGIDFIAQPNFQWYSLLAIIPLIFYSGEKGKLKIKYLFYIYYPLHMLVIYALQLLLLY